MASHVIETPPAVLISGDILAAGSTTLGPHRNDDNGHRDEHERAPAGGSGGRPDRAGRSARVAPGGSLPASRPSRPSHPVSGRVTAAEGGLRVPALRAAAPGPGRFGRSALRPPGTSYVPRGVSREGAGLPPPGPAARPALRPNRVGAVTARGCRERTAYGSSASASRPREQLKARHEGRVEGQPSRRAHLQRQRLTARHSMPWQCGCSSPQPPARADDDDGDGDDRDEGEDAEKETDESSG